MVCGSSPSKCQVLEETYRDITAGTTSSLQLRNLSGRKPSSTSRRNAPCTEKRAQHHPNTCASGTKTQHHPTSRNLIRSILTKLSHDLRGSHCRLVPRPTREEAKHHVHGQVGHAVTTGLRKSVKLPVERTGTAGNAEVILKHTVYDSSYDSIYKYV